MTKKEFEEEIQNIKKKGFTVKKYDYINGVRQGKFKKIRMFVEDIYSQKYGEGLGLIWRYDGKRFGCRVEDISSNSLNKLLSMFNFWFEDSLNNPSNNSVV